MKEMSLKEEASLVAIARDGDEDAMNTLLEASRSGAYRRVLKIVHDSDEAEDVVQDTLLVAWKSFRGFRQSGRFSHWVCVIAQHRALDAIRKRNRGWEINQKLINEVHAAYEKGDAWNEMQVKSLQHDWEQSMLEQIDLLPIKYSMVLLLRYIQELSYEEIAQILAMPLSHVKTQLHRARLLLRKQLQELEAARDANIATVSARLMALAADVEERMTKRGHLKSPSDS